MRPARIALVDGSPLQRRLLAGRLGEMGHDVVAFPRAEEALEALAAEPFDAVIADVILPGAMDGFELCAALLARAPAGAPAVVLAPGFEPGEGDLRMAADAGAAAMVQRQAGFAEVLAALSTALAGRPPAPERHAPPMPPEVDRALRGRRVLLAGFPTAEADRAERVLRSVGILPRSVTWDAALGAGIDPDEIVLASVEAGSLPRPVQLRGGGAVLAVGSPDALCRAAPLGIRHLLTRPWRPEALLLRVYLAVRETEAGDRRPVPIGGPPRDLVLADDDETITALLAATLAHDGYRCHVAHDGHRALELIEQVRPGAAVLDVNMPRKDGFQVLAALRDGRRIRDLPVVLLTARRQELDILRGFELGAADYVVKPFNPLELAARLRRLAPMQ